MELTFLGTGEAFDTRLGNSAYLVETSKSSVLVDCGYQVAYSLRRLLKEQRRSTLDIPEHVLLTHFHGDHFAGLSAFLIPLWDEVRDNKGIEKKLTIASAHPDVKERVEKRIVEDYPGLYERFKEDGFRVDFEVMNTEGHKLTEDLTIKAALTCHSVPNYAYRFEQNGKSLAISGDGALSDASRELYQGVDLLVHEGFFVDKHSPTHASIAEVVDYAREANISRVALIHVNQAEREKTEQIKKITERAKGVEVFFPEDYQSVHI